MQNLMLRVQGAHTLQQTGGAKFEAEGRSGRTGVLSMELCEVRTLLRRPGRRRQRWQGRTVRGPLTAGCLYGKGAPLGTLAACHPHPAPSHTRPPDHGHHTSLELHPWVIGIPTQYCIHLTFVLVLIVFEKGPIRLGWVCFSKQMRNKERERWG